MKKAAILPFLLLVLASCNSQGKKSGGNTFSVPEDFKKTYEVSPSKKGTTLSEGDAALSYFYISNASLSKANKYVKTPIELGNDFGKFAAVANYKTDGAVFNNVTMDGSLSDEYVHYSQRNQNESENVDYYTYKQDETRYIVNEIGSSQSVRTDVLDPTSSINENLVAPISYCRDVIQNVYDAMQGFFKNDEEYKTLTMKFASTGDKCLYASIISKKMGLQVELLCEDNWPRYLYYFVDYSLLKQFMRSIGDEQAETMDLIPYRYSSFEFIFEENNCNYKYPTFN